MKNKLIFLFNSMRQSVVNKPFVFAMLIFIFFASTLCCSIPSRIVVGSILYDTTNSSGVYVTIGGEKFVENRLSIGEYIAKNEERLAFEDNLKCTFQVHQYNCNLIINNKEIKFDHITVGFVMAAQYGITKENIDKGQNVISINENLAREYGIKINDTIEMYGNSLSVQSINFDTGNFVYLPYNIKIDKWYDFAEYSQDSKNINANVSGSIYGLDNKALGEVKREMGRLGCRIGFHIDDISMGFVVLLIMLIISMVATISIMNYWLKCNGRKYSTYKTLGCSPQMLSATIIVETLLIAIFSIGLGLIVDLIIGLFIETSMVIVGLEWLHYLILLTAPLLCITIMTIITVIKMAIVVPANAKCNK